LAQNSATPMKRRILVTRAGFPEALDRSRARFEVDDNPGLEAGWRSA
jgi:hypothetical protein